MRLFSKLIAHFVGNGFKWIYYRGSKSMDEVIKDDNSTLGFIVIIILIFITLGLNN